MDFQDGSFVSPWGCTVDRDTAWQQAALKTLIEEPAEGQMF